ncbi:MAG: HAD-IIIA family hydrolase [Thiolinea sp.]
MIQETEAGTAMVGDERPYQLLIFDWDGTLMDSAARIVQCMHAAAQSVDAPLADEAAVRNITGLSLEVAVPLLFAGLDAVRQQALIAEFRRQSLGREIQAAQLFDGVEAGLRELAGQGYQLAIATGKSRRGLDQDLAELGLAELFPITRTADETFSKPHPRMLEEILTDYDQVAARALMIGDTEYDLQMAANAGMAALAVSYGVHEPERLLKLQPKAVLDEFAQLPLWLKHGYSQ